MAVAGSVVEPGGIDILRMLFGIPGSMGDPGPGAANFLGNLFGGGQGGMFAGFGDIYNQGFRGDLTAPSNPYLDWAIDGEGNKDSAGNRAADWENSWNQFYNTDLMDPNDPTKLLQRSPISQTGMRVGRTFGGFGANGASNVQDTDLYRQLFGGTDANGEKTYGALDNYKDSSTGLGEYFDPKNWADRMSSDTQTARNDLKYNRYSTPTNWSSDLIPLSQWRTEQLNTLSPEAAAQGYFGLADARKLAGYDPVQLAQAGMDKGMGYAQSGIDQGTKYDAAAVANLNSAIDQEANRSLSLQLPEVRQQAQMLGLTDGAAGERLGGDVARDVIGSAARKKADVIAQYQDSAANRHNQLLGNYQNVGGQLSGNYQDIGSRAGDSLLSGAGNLYGQQYGARERTLDNMYQTSADLLGRGQSAAYSAATGLSDDIMRLRTGATQAGMQANMDRGNRMMGINADIANSAFSGITQRMGLEDQSQSQALRDYMGLVGSRDTYRGNRMNELLGLSGERQNYDQSVLNQQAQYGMMPMNWLMQLITGVPTSGAPSNQGFNWGSLLGAAAPSVVNYGLGMMNTSNPTVDGQSRA